MKKAILLLVAVASLSCNTDELDQPSTPLNIDPPIQLVSELNTWYINGGFTYSNFLTGGFDTTKRHQIYFFKGDTLINGSQYKKMYYKQLDSIFSDSNSVDGDVFVSTYTNLNYASAMRQDSSVVFYVPRNKTTEELYADFNMAIGDTLNYKWNTTGEIVTQIDSLAIGSKYITKYKLSNGEYFYEGIGASYGLFKDWGVGIEGGEYLTCFKHDSDKIEIEDGFLAPNNYCPEF